MPSPYADLPVEAWEAKTLELIAAHPLDSNALYAIVLQAWQDIFQSRIGSKPFHIGADLFPTPQIMGFFLHELIALELENHYPGVWQRSQTSGDKDLVYLSNPAFSVEIKTSSSGKNIYGNRSYAQQGESSKKDKSGYYLAVNFGKFSVDQRQPEITRVRFGWLDHSDWMGQLTATGQQARLSPAVERYKLISLPLRKE